MRQLFVRLLGWTARPAAPQGGPPAKPRVRPTPEPLEDRLVLTVSVINGDLHITQTAAADTCVVSQNKNYEYFVEDNGVVYKFTSGDLTGGDVFYHGYGGGDEFSNGSELRATAYGGGGNDSLSSVGFNNRLFGDRGDDKIVGGYGDDLLSGGAGNDTLWGFYGNDRLIGGNPLNQAGVQDNDEMHGGEGDDLLLGRAGHDDLFGDGGFDRLRGDGGKDYLDGGHDGIADDLRGGAGADVFQTESYWIGLHLANRDAPKDFQPADGDTFLGVFNF